jgi:hypothetical protein
MDNIFQLIIFIFVIWSILGSAFGKKKNQKSKTQQRRFPGEGSNNPSPNYRQTSQDVLEDILGFKIPKTEDEYYGGVSHEAQDIEKNSTDLEKDTSQISVRTKFEQSVEDVDYDKLGSLEQVPLQIISTEATDAYTVSQATISRAPQIKSRFKSANSVRDAILIAEIINKPKALRR